MNRDLMNHYRVQDYHQEDYRNLRMVGLLRLLDYWTIGIRTIWIRVYIWRLKG